MAVTFCATWRAHTVVYTCCQPYSHTGIYNPFKIIEPLANGVCKFASSELSPWWRWQLGSNRLQVAQHCTFALVLNQFRSIISSLWPNNNTILPKNGIPATLSQNNLFWCHVVVKTYHVFAMDKCFIGGFCWIEVCCCISTLSYSSPIPTNHDRSHYGCGPMCTYHRLSAITHCTRNIEQHPSMLWPHSLSKLKRVILF